MNIDYCIISTQKVKDNLDFKQINENYKLFRNINNLTINSKSCSKYKH